MLADRSIVQRLGALLLCPVLTLMLLQSSLIPASAAEQSFDRVSFSASKRSQCAEPVEAAPLRPNQSLASLSPNQPTAQRRTSLLDYVQDNVIRTILEAEVVLVLMAVLLYQRQRTRKASKEKEALISATERDKLTELYNSGFFFEYANRLYRDHPELHLEALMLNIDSFHTVNSLFGREFGDTVLCLLSGAIKDYLKGGLGIAGRIEADCFVLYCPHTADYVDILTGFQRELNRFNSGVRLRMGVMPWARDVEPMQMIERARTACGAARKVFKPHMVVFDENMHQRELFEQRLLNDLEWAVQDGQLLVCYQPKYAIQCETPRLISAEALIRWRHPELGMISPADFIPLLERSGRVGVVDKFVWRETARQIAAWRDVYGVVIPVSVNLSRVDIFDPKLVETIEELVAANGLERSVLKLEVTESAYTEDADRVIEVVNSLRQKGYQIEMDDFGAGYSSLNMLSSLPVDVLKMDQGFVRNIGRDEKDDRLVALILDIARNLKVPVVAEGVETKKQLEVLKTLGCEYVQGFYFSHPVHPADFEKLAFESS